MFQSVAQLRLQIIVHEADQAARRLRRHLWVSHCDVEDIRQDLLTDFLSRMTRFDPKRGSLGAFAGLVMANRGRRLAACIRHHRRTAGPLSLDQPLSTEDATTFGDTIAESDGYLAMMGLRTDPIVSMELRFDLDSGAWRFGPARSAALHCADPFLPNQSHRARNGLARDHLSAPAQNPETPRRLRSHKNRETLFRVRSSSMHGHCSHRLASEGSAQCCQVLRMAVGSGSGRHARVLPRLSFGRYQPLQWQPARSATPGACARRLPGVAGVAARPRAPASTPNRRQQLRIFSGRATRDEARPLLRSP